MDAASAPEVDLDKWRERQCQQLMLLSRKLPAEGDNAALDRRDEQTTKPTYLHAYQNLMQFGCVMNPPAVSRTDGQRQTTADCVDEAPDGCSAIDAVLDQACLNDILQHMRSAFKVAVYGAPVHLVLAAVAAAAFWSGASSELLIVFFCQEAICILACGIVAARCREGIAAGKAAAWGLRGATPAAAEAHVAVDIAPAALTHVAAPGAGSAAATAGPAAAGAAGPRRGRCTWPAAPLAPIQAWRPAIAIISVQLLATSLLLVTFIFCAFYYFWPDYLHDRAHGTDRISGDTPATIAARLSPLLCAAITACAVLGWLAADLHVTGGKLESDLLRVAAATFAAAAGLIAAGLLLVLMLIAGAVSMLSSERWVADSVVTLVALCTLLVYAALWWRHIALLP
eukprot:jgi/Ulvmu1/2318/UM013_0166.1